MQAEILFIKTSSLGDVVHHMPAVTDVRRHFPHARLSWVVEEPYGPLVRLHPGVDEVIPVATRRWRANLLSPSTWRCALREIGRFREAIRARAYDATIDTQGLLRTALIAGSVRGARHGYDRASIKEPLACLFYDVRHWVEWRAHAIPRNRALCAVALGYEAKCPLDYGLDRAEIARGPATVPARAPYAVLIHATAQPGKRWTQAHWVAVARGVHEQGFDVVLPWGADAERASSVAIAAAAGIGEVPDRRPLDAVAALIAGASFVVGVDTGLVHVAAALGVPLVAIFVDSEPGLTGPMGTGPIAVVGGKGASPDPADVLRALDRVAARAT
jgi:heptosyltransferase-1